jgi:Uncharacterized protein conserved in bacteria (DUF2188)
MAAPNFAMEPCLFTVQQRDDTRWHVLETGLPRSLASFGLREDAIEYARDLARAWLGEADRHVANVSERCEHASSEEARYIGARAAASLAAGAIKKPATSRA